MTISLYKQNHSTAALNQGELNMFKKLVTIKTLLIVLVVAFISYGLITRCENVAIYKYCEEENHQFGE